MGGVLFITCLLAVTALQLQFATGRSPWAGPEYSVMEQVTTRNSLIKSVQDYFTVSLNEYSHDFPMNAFLKPKQKFNISLVEYLVSACANLYLATIHCFIQ